MNDSRNIITSNIINQLVIRARLHHHQQQEQEQEQNNVPIEKQAITSHYEGLQLVMSIKVSIPYSIIPSPGSPPLILPLMPDRNLRLDSSSVFPLYRKSSNSRPILQSCNLPIHHAQLAASVLNLSQSFRVQNHKLPQLPVIRVVVRNFTISLFIPPYLSLTRHPNHPSLVAEYAIVLECLSLFSTIGPEWPFSVILPTPPCLKNSFRLLLPMDSTEKIQPSVLHLNTFPPLMRERFRSSNLPRNRLSGTPSSVPSDDDVRPLSDESEPEGISSLPDDDDESNHDSCSNWPQDERSPRIEGVFQSTKELCILIGSGPQIQSSALQNPITAKRASTRLSISIPRPPSKTVTNSHSVSVDLNFHVDLEQIGTQSTHHKTPLILAIPQNVTHQIIFASWSPLDGQGSVQTSFPPTRPGEDQITSSSSLLTNDQPSPTSSSSSIDLTLLPNAYPTSSELELLNTAAPFSEFNSDTRADNLLNQLNQDLKLDVEATQSEKLVSETPYQFVAWFDTEWLIRSVATSQNQSNPRLTLNLHGRLDLAILPSPTACDSPSHSFPIPFFILPSVSEQVCECQISYAPTDSSSLQELKLDLPPWASLLGSSSDQQLHRLELRLNNSTHTQTMDSAIMAHLHHSELPQASGAGVMSSEQKNMPPSLAESSVNIGTLIISPAGRIRHHNRKSTISNSNLVRKRPRPSLSFKSKLEKILTLGDEKATKTGPIERPTKIAASIRSVQIDLVVDSSSPSESPLTQYSELAITLSRPTQAMVDPWVSVTFRTQSDDTVEMLGAWIGNRELVRYEGFEYYEELESGNETGEASRLVLIQFNVPDICISGKLEDSQPIPVLRMIIKSQTPGFIPKTEPISLSQAPQEKESNLFSCLLPSFGSSVGTYKVSLHTCSHSCLVIDRSNMLILENSTRGTALVQYSIPPHVINQTWASVKPAISLSQAETLERSPLVELSDSHPVEGHDAKNKKHQRDSENEFENLMGRLGWLKHFTVTWQFNFKTLLFCWLIYLVSFASIQLNEIGARLDMMDQRLSEQLLTQSSFKMQLPYQPAQPGVELHPDSNHSKEEYFGYTFKTFLSHMIANAFKPSWFIFKDILATNSDEVVT